MDPTVSMHYWDWTQDPKQAPDGKGGTVNLFTPQFMGNSSGQARAPLESNGFYNETADPFRSENEFDSNNNPFDPPRYLWRGVKSGGVQSKIDDANLVQNNDTFTAFWHAIEGPHGDAHSHIGGDPGTGPNRGGGTLTDPHKSFRDPFVFLLHSNVDRLFALWQLSNQVNVRLDPDLVYDVQETTKGSGDITFATWGILSPIEPWAGPDAQNSATGVVTNVKKTRPWAAPENEQNLPENQKNHKHWTIVRPPSYDSNPTVIQVQNPGNIINFNQIPESETTIRAARFRFVSSYPLTFKVKSAPNLPFRVFSTGGTVGPVAASKDSIWTEALFWFSFTGDTPNTSSSSIAVISCESPVFSQDFTFNLTSFSITRPTAAIVLTLDQSGSMDEPAGTTGLKRIDALRYAAKTFVEVIQSGNAMGLVNFDTKAYPVNDATYPGLPVTTIGDGILDTNRSAARNAVNKHVTNVNGMTSIGAGIQASRQLLNSAGAWDVKAMIVFTDGIENTDPKIASVLGDVNALTFAIGLGNPQQISTAALNAITNATGGYTYITGALGSSDDDFFKLTKYFLQILAGVTNNQIVLDPSGFLPHRVTVDIPFTVSDVDIETTVVLNCDLPALEFSLRTSSGKIIRPSDATPGSGVKFYDGQLTRYYRLTNLVTVQGQQQSPGTWYATLKINEAFFEKFCARAQANESLQDLNVGEEHQVVLNTVAFQPITPCKRGGVRYSLSMYSWSNLRMKADVHPSILEPGSKFTVRARLDEFDVPFSHATVSVELTNPDGTSQQLVLSEGAAGVYEGTTQADIPGVYNVRVTASGVTSKGFPFTRESVLTASIFAGANDPLPGGQGSSGNTGGGDGCQDSLCCLTKSLLHNDSVDAILKKNGLDPSSILKSVEECCQGGKK